jgi:hypothetical protein
MTYSQFLAALFIFTSILLFDLRLLAESLPLPPRESTQAVERRRQIDMPGTSRVELCWTPHN